MMTKVITADSVVLMRTVAAFYSPEEGGNILSCGLLFIAFESELQEMNGQNRLFFEFDSGGRRGHSCKLFKKRIRLDIRIFAFSNRIVDTWNVLIARQ